MNISFLESIKKATGATHAYEVEVIQSLWSGYGKIVRYGLEGCNRKSVVIKHVILPDQTNHPRGWNTDLSHQRKLKSYQVETAWYRLWADHCDEFAPIPHCLALESHNDEVLMVLEDLDASGYPLRKTSITQNEFDAVLTWLAEFHAIFMDKRPTDLWDIGTYWHLDTRPEELLEIDDRQLKASAPLLDKKLNSATYKTFVHGDAKLANFCFSRNGKEVSAVDFQYVGGGCGMKDVAYFVGSVFYEDDCEKLERQILSVYFKALKKALIRRGFTEYEAVEREWRDLYRVAWADFHRFLKGWSPGHWKINSYSERVTREVIGLL